MTRRAAVVLALLLPPLLLARVAAAHATIENALQVVVSPQRLTLEMRVSLEQVDVAHEISNTIGSETIDPAKLDAAIKQHAEYLLSHLDVRGDDQPLTGRMTRIIPPPSAAEGVAWTKLESTQATYLLDYDFAGARPKAITISHTILSEHKRLGQPWEVNFAVQVRHDHEQTWTPSLITRTQPLRWTCEWSDGKHAGGPPTTSAALQGEDGSALGTKLNLAHTARVYTWHGLHHILTGYDHLLFVAALVIAATRLWDLVKVVSAFTIAHTLTMTLSVLDIVRLPSSIVEPIIAGSIVVVAMQNLLFPRQSRGWSRLAIAFAFGLFHGLGFAGGLVDAMEGMPSINLAAALLCFTIGVEVAHQLLIVPLFFALKLVRRPTGTGEPSPSPKLPMPLRCATVAISLAGMFYLVQSLRGA
jgi:hydrogenase/urease accessory protein HupE